MWNSLYKNILDIIPLDYFTKQIMNRVSFFKFLEE